MKPELKPGDTRYIAADVLYIAGADVFTHPQTLWFKSEQEAHIKGKINWDEPVLRVVCQADGTLYCQEPPAGTVLHLASAYVHRQGTQVWLVDDDGKVYRDVPHRYCP